MVKMRWAFLDNVCGFLFRVVQDLTVISSPETLVLIKHKKYLHKTPFREVVSIFCKSGKFQTDSQVTKIAFTVCPNLYVLCIHNSPVSVFTTGCSFWLTCFWWFFGGLTFGCLICGRTVVLCSWAISLSNSVFNVLIWLS